MLRSELRRAAESPKLNFSDLQNPKEVYSLSLYLSLYLSITEFV
jgi:hypothetical protein